tara:strand:- start:252 stop:767 length:516 start_codon:yes stop_codon:yes gene_type:complete
VKIKKFIIILAIYLAAHSSFAEDKHTENLDLFMGAWLTNCSSNSGENEKNCALERSLFIDKKRTKKLITISMQTKSSTDVRFILVSPLGTLVQSGVKIGFDDKLISKSPYGFNICQQFGCITSMMVKKETLERFKKSDNLNLEYIGAKGQKIEIKFSLSGFEKEFQKIANN